jgi:hypothetical protein
MNIADSLKRMQAKIPGSSNGRGATEAASDAAQPASASDRGPWPVVGIVAPLLVAGIATYFVRRRSTEHAAGGKAEGSVGKGKSRRRRPHNFFRYYGLAILISALEREATRRAVIGLLRWAQRRA